MPTIARKESAPTMGDVRYSCGCVLAVLVLVVFAAFALHCFGLLSR